jgi:precorrin-2/cobalt-factor-2 C20-methyltransferase
MENVQGIFYGIGVGPGDPELLTVKAINAIRNSEVIIAPKTEKKSDSLALTIATPYLRSDVQIIFQTFPMVKDFETSPEVFEDNVAEILSYLREGKTVGFLTLGDPMFFSTYIYIFKLLKKSGVKIETVAGVPAFLAIAAKIGYPVAYGNEILSIIPATADNEKISNALKNSDDAVLMKVYKNFGEVAEILDNENLSENAVLVSRCGLKDEKIISDLNENKNEKLNYLSTILTRRKV